MNTKIPLPTRVDLLAAQSLKSAFLEADGAVEISADAVEMIGAQGLQVMIAGARHIAGAGGSVEIASPSAGFLSCLNDLGATLADVTTPGGAA